MTMRSTWKILFPVVVLYCAQWASAETLAYPNKITQRKLTITRHYEIAVKKEAVSMAAIPALMSFWGETNWQIVKASRFQYSEKPDKIEITADNKGMPRRYYQLTWNAPKSDKIAVDQILDVELSCFNTLYTAAKFPYANDVLKRYEASLAPDDNEGINPNNPDLVPICNQIVRNSNDAEEIVEKVCDWINENIKFVDGEGTSDQTLAKKKGSCGPMSKLACAMLRKIGIPAELVVAKFIGSKSGHVFIEVYFPDAGWVFYDLSNHTRGFKSLDCLMTVGWSYLAGRPEKMRWVEGYFCAEKDAATFKDPELSQNSRSTRKAPAGKIVAGVIAVKQAPPSTVKPRQRPLRELILDLNTPPAERDYTDNQLSPAAPAK